MSRKFIWDTDYYTTKDLFDKEGEDGDVYVKKVNKVTGDPFAAGSTFECSKDPFTAWIDWDTDSLKTSLYFALPFGNGDDWWTFITTDTTSPQLTWDEKRYMLYALFMTNANDGIYKFKDGIIYFLRDDYFKIRDYMGISLPVENLSEDYTTKQPTTLFNVIRNSGHIGDFPMPIDEMWLIKNGGDYKPDITFKIATYNRTYIGWFGYVFQPNCKSHFLSYDQFQKSNGEIINTVRIIPWDNESVNAAVTKACSDSILKEQNTGNVENFSNNYNKALYNCLVAAGLSEIEDDIKRIYENTDWCLRNDLQTMINKLDNFNNNLGNIYNATTNLSYAVQYIKNIFDNFADYTTTLKDRIMSTGTIRYWKGENRMRVMENGTVWYTKLSPNDSRQECWRPLQELFMPGLTTLAIDFPTLYNNGFKWLYGPIEISDLISLRLVQSKVTGSVNITETDGTYKVGDHTIITTQNFDNIPFNIQKYFYWLVKNYNRNAGKNEYNPLEIYSTAYGMNTLLKNLNQESKILIFLQRDVGKILSYTDNLMYTTQTVLAMALTEYTRQFDSIKYLERFWEIFMLPDTIERYAVARSKMYRVSVENLSMQIYRFEPGAVDSKILKNGGAIIQMRLKELNVEIANNWLIVPDNTYHGEAGDWFLYKSQISENRENTVIIDGNEYEKVYYFHFEFNNQTLDIPWMQFDLSDVPYTKAPEVEDLTDMSMFEYLEYMTEVNYQQLQMLDVLINICEECCKDLGTINKDGNNYSVFGLESYDQEQLQRFYPIYNAFCDYEEEICNKIQDLNDLLTDQQSWLYKALEITEDKNDFIVKITSSRFTYNTNRIDRDLTVEGYLGLIRTNFNTIVQLVEESNQYKYYTTIDPISSDLTNSGAKQWLWDNSKTEVEDYRNILSNSATVPIYIENIQLYYKYHENHAFNYIYILRIPDDTNPGTITPKLVMSSHNYDNYSTDGTLKALLITEGIITVGENDTITENYTKYTINN